MHQEQRLALCNLLMGHVCLLLFQTMAYQNCSWVDSKGGLPGDQNLNSTSRIQKPPICPFPGFLNQAHSLCGKEKGIERRRVFAQ